MSGIKEEILALEERLRQAELGPDPAVFEDLLADDVVLVGDEGKPAFTKKDVVNAHRPGQGPKFTRVEMSDVRVIDQNPAAVVTCQGFFAGPKGAFTLRFLRVWLKKAGRWQIVAASVAALTDNKGERT